MIIIFDFDDTIYNTEKNRLYDQVELVLGELKQMQHNLFLIAQGDHTLEIKMTELSIDSFFDKIYIVEKKTGEEYEEIMSTYNTEKYFYLVGDDLYKEIEMANTAGLTTVWFNPEKQPMPADLPIMNQPRFEIECMYDLLPILP